MRDELGGVGSGPPFHAEHVGSLLRPQALREAFRAHREGSMDTEEFGAIQDAAIRDAVAMQERVGLRVVTDGEFRRASYWAHWVEGIDGLTIDDASFRFRDDAGHEQAFTAPSVVGELRRSRPVSAPEYEFTSAQTRAVVKVTMPSPSTFLFWRGETTLPEVYASGDAFFEDLCAVYRAEIADLSALGCRYIQLDEVPLVMLADPAVREAVERRGEDPDRLVTQYLAALNSALEGRPGQMIAAVHICRGNYKGGWLAEGGYEPIAERAFRELDADVFFLEYDTERAGDFAPLRHIPDTKRVVLGLISSKTADMERPEALRRRIELASEYIPRERLGLSPQCGFASAAGGNPITPEAQEAKLRMVVEVANGEWPTAPATDD
jgi:5-methyltetrahydropteroyltriglutamate--homocysteine methyltransferase